RLGGGLAANVQLALPQDRVDAGDVAPHGLQPAMILELPGGGGETQVEQLLLGLLQLRGQALVVHPVQVGGHEVLRPDSHQMSPPSREMKRVFIGSLCCARRRASRASSSSTPPSSNIARPRLTLATHHSGEPLPEPIRVSAGFLVSGRSGKMLIHTFPPRLMCRVMAIRAASICRLVT